MPTLGCRNLEIMALTLGTDIASLRAQRGLAAAQGAINSSLSRLSSGYRITRASDDAAGLGVGTKLGAELRSWNQATKNANDGISVVEAAEGGLEEQANILGRVRELATRAASDGIGDAARGYCDEEAQGLLDEIARVASVTSYGGKQLLDGSGARFDFHVGVGNTGADVISWTAPTYMANPPSPPTPTPPSTPFATVFAAAATAFAGAMTGGGTIVDAMIAAESAAASAGGAPATAAALTGSLHLMFETGYRDAGGLWGDPPPTSSAVASASALLAEVAAVGGPGSNHSLQVAYSAYASSLVDGATFGNTLAAWEAADAALTAASSPSGFFGANAAEFTFQAAFFQASGVGYPFPDPVPAGAAFDAALNSLGYAGGAGPGPARVPDVLAGLGLAGLSLATEDGARRALGAVDAALDKVSRQRAGIGAVGNRLQSAVATIQDTRVALSAASSRIMDVDVAAETSELTRSEIVQNASAAVLAQVNQSAQLALKLLG